MGDPKNLFPEDKMAFPFKNLSVPATRRNIQKGTGAHCVFLLDEFHCNDAATDEGVQVAIELANHAGVKLIGVEGYVGGREFSDLGNFTGTIFPPSLDRIITDYTRFAEALVDFGVAEVIGVDCETFANLAEIEKGKRPADRPSYHVLRSSHFVDTLLDVHRDRPEGNMLINCGKNHNDDIEVELRNGTDAGHRWREFTFIRFRPDSHGEGQL